MPHRPSTRLVRWLFLRGLAATHLIALLSLWWQIDALVGPDGILPLAPWLEALRDHYGGPIPGRLPTLAWVWPSMTALHLQCAIGVAIAVALLVTRIPEGPGLLALAAIYLSVSTAGRLFWQFQWDTLLVEATVTALVVARWSRRDREPPVVAQALTWWLAFRVLFLGGIVKLTSGDPQWSNLTALDVHFFTQPLPNPLSRAAHHLPAVLRQAGVAATLIVELVLPWLIVFGRRGRAVVFAAGTALMTGLALTGNYGFFQLLTVVVLLPLLDDAHLGHDDRAAPAVSAPAVTALAGSLFVLSALHSPTRIVSPTALPSWWQAIVHRTAPFRVANPYGLFAVMTDRRPEIVFEVTTDGRTWRELALAAKPGPVDRVPAQVAPHMPRLDWQLWFAALGRCERNPWVMALMHRMVDGPGPVARLFPPGSFDGPPILAVRAQRYDYRFAPWGSDAVWTRQPLGLYCPVVVRPP